MPRIPEQPEHSEQLGLDLGELPDRLFVCTPSKLSAYLDCPRRYRYTYVDRPAPPKGPPWGHNSLGASLHTALKNWYGLAVEQRRTAALATLLRATWVREGYRDDEQERAAFGRGLAWLEAYVGTLDPADEPVGVERTVAAKTSVLAMSGRVDRIDRRGDELVIVDYKSGRYEPSSDDARGSLALAMYAYASTRQFRRTCHRVELHHLPTGTVAAHEHTDASLDRHVGRAEGAAKDIIAAEKALAAGADPDQAFPTQPGALCSWCDYKRVCPAGSGAPSKEPWAGVGAVQATEAVSEA